jgi:hypothetical protein
VKLTDHTYVLQQFDKFWIWRSIWKTKTAEICQKDILTLDGLEKGQLIQLDYVTRINLALRNQGQLAPFVCYLVSKIGNFAMKLFDQKKFLSYCSKQLVTPVNLTRNFLILFNFQDWEQTPRAKNCLLWESFSPLCNSLLGSCWNLWLSTKYTRTRPFSFGFRNDKVLSFCTYFYIVLWVAHFGWKSSVGTFGENLQCALLVKIFRKTEHSQNC